MRVLIIGGGGREHALAWKLMQEEPTLALLAAPGNPGIAELAECISIGTGEIAALAALARERSVDLTIVGPEAPLAAGIVDHFRAAGLPIFGPTKAAAEIETSKAFAKQLMLDEGIPTARAEMHTQVTAAKDAARRFGAPVVIKASGLAAGKGVIICQSFAEADQAIDDMLEGNRFGAAGAEVLVEEFMEGEEISLFAITDGTSYVILPGLQDHKRLKDGDVGPNTGGMGAYLPVTRAMNSNQQASEQADQAISQHAQASLIVGQALRALERRGRAFTGLLYAGLMVTRTGPKVVEFNCRFGDPETQALMPVLSIRPRLLDLMLAIGRGERIAGCLEKDAPGAVSPSRVELSGACVTVVLAAAGYPDTPRLGDVITLPPAEDGVFVFHAGTTRDAEGRLITSGGRVLAVSAMASTIAAARSRSLDYAGRIDFAGKQFRRDIGWREIARHVQS